MKKYICLLLAVLLLASSAALGESAVDVIMNTGTTQAFTDEAVPAEDMETILRAGLSAASAINQQPWFFVTVTDQELMKEIAGSGMGGFTPPAGTGDKPEGAPAGGTDGFPGGALEGAPEGMPQNAPGGAICLPYLPLAAAARKHRWEIHRRRHHPRSARNEDEHH